MLRDAERVTPGVILETSDVAVELSVSGQEVEDQLDILKHLGAITLTRFMGSASFRARLTGEGKLLLEGFESRLAPQDTSKVGVTAHGQLADEGQFQWDVFIAHASEDKALFVNGLADALRSHIRVWYDDFVLVVGDSLRQRIDEGLAKSRYGVVVLSPRFFEKVWPQKELDGLAVRAAGGAKVILPVWLDVDHSEVAAYSPMLAGVIAAKNKDGLAEVVAQLLAAMDIPDDTAADSTARDIRDKSDLRLVARVHKYRFAGGTNFPAPVLTLSVENTGDRNAFVDKFEVLAVRPFEAPAVRYEFRDARIEGIERDLPMNIPAHGVSDKIKIIAHFDRGFGPEGTPFRLQIAAIGPYEYERADSQLAGKVSATAQTP